MVTLAAAAEKPSSRANKKSSVAFMAEIGLGVKKEMRLAEGL
jgi:hypothetical protein